GSSEKEMERPLSAMAIASKKSSDVTCSIPATSIDGNSKFRLDNTST
ncbi:MAG: hypothetical protein EZS28_027913, partial [Streblomastix strix]